MSVYREGQRCFQKTKYQTFGHLANIEWTGGTTISAAFNQIDKENCLPVCALCSVHVLDPFVFRCCLCSRRTHDVDVK